jgi:hypothetical protein
MPKTAFVRSGTAETKRHRCFGVSVSAMSLPRVSLPRPFQTDLASLSQPKVRLLKTNS